MLDLKSTEMDNLQRHMKQDDRRKVLYGMLDELSDQIVQDPQKLDNFVRQWKNGFHSYSLNNTILAMIQYPKMSLLAGYHAWKKKGRHVRTGEKAIWILSPIPYNYIKELPDGEEEEHRGVRFKPTKVWDILQTDENEGAKPIDLGCSSFVTGNIDFITFAEKCPYEVELHDEPGVSNGWLDRNGRIHVREKENDAAMTACLFHEWTHRELRHHEDPFDKLDSRPVKEIMAETGSYICSSFYGLQHEKAAYYVGNWGGSADLLRGYGKRIISSSEKIIRALSEVKET